MKSKIFYLVLIFHFLILSQSVFSQQIDLIVFLKDSNKIISNYSSYTICAKDTVVFKSNGDINNVKIEHCSLLIKSQNTYVCIEHPHWNEKITIVMAQNCPSNCIELYSPNVLSNTPDTLLAKCDCKHIVRYTPKEQSKYKRDICKSNNQLFFYTQFRADRVDVIDTTSIENITLSYVLETKAGLVEKIEKYDVKSSAYTLLSNTYKVSGKLEKTVFFSSVSGLEETYIFIYKNDILVEEQMFIGSDQYSKEFFKYKNRLLHSSEKKYFQQGDAEQAEVRIWKYDANMRLTSIQSNFTSNNFHDERLFRYNNFGNKILEKQTSKEGAKHIVYIYEEKTQNLKQVHEYLDDKLRRKVFYKNGKESKIFEYDTRKDKLILYHIEYISYRHSACHVRLL